MSLYVVDASVGVKWLVPEIDSDLALRLQDPGYELHAPSLFDAEVANAIWKKLRRGELSSLQAHSIIAQLPSVPLFRHAERPIMLAAFEIAEVADRTIHDSLYVALADRLGGQVVTADERFANSLAGTPWGHFNSDVAAGAVTLQSPTATASWSASSMLTT